MQGVLYTAILSKCNWGDKTFRHDYPIVMGAIVTAKSPLSITSWAILLSPLLKMSLENIISELHPLLSGMDQPSTLIQLLHQSLQDYLKWHDVNRVWTKLESATNQEWLALWCFQVTNDEIRKVAGLGWIGGDAYDSTDKYIWTSGVHMLLWAGSHVACLVCLGSLRNRNQQVLGGEHHYLVWTMCSHWKIYINVLILWLDWCKS